MRCFNGTLQKNLASNAVRANPCAEVQYWIKNMFVNACLFCFSSPKNSGAKFVILDYTTWEGQQNFILGAPLSDF